MLPRFAAALVLFALSSLALDPPELEAQGGLISVQPQYAHGTYYNPTLSRTISFLVTTDPSTPIVRSTCYASGGATCTLVDPARDADYTATPYQVKEIPVSVDFSGANGTSNIQVSLTSDAFPDPAPPMSSDQDQYTYVFLPAPLHRVEITVPSQSLTRDEGQAGETFDFKVKNTGAAPFDDIKAWCVNASGNTCVSPLSASPSSQQYQSGQERTVTVTTDLMRGLQASVQLNAELVNHPTVTASTTAQVTMTQTLYAGTTGPIDYMGVGGTRSYTFLGEIASNPLATTCVTTGGVTCNPPGGGFPTISSSDPGDAVTVTLVAGSTPSSASVDFKVGLTPMEQASATVAFPVYELKPTIVSSGPSGLGTGATGTVNFVVSSPAGVAVPYTLTYAATNATITGSNPSTINVQSGSPVVVPVTIQKTGSGTASVTLTATTNKDNLPYTDSRPHTISGVTDIVVTPENASNDVTAGKTGTVSFDVTKNAAGTHSMTFSPTCGNFTNCALVSAPTTLDQDETGKVLVSFTAGDVGTSATIILAASASGLATASGSTQANAVAATITPTGANPGMVFDRSQCVNIGAGPVAIQCDDAVFAFGIPAVTTLNKPRPITLLYNSGLVRARPVVAADIAVTETATAIQGILSLSGKSTQGFVLVDQVDYDVTQLPQNIDSVRLVMAPDEASRKTGLYETMIEAHVTDGGVTATQTVIDTIAIVNWKDSEVGPGWSHSARERIYTGELDGTFILWVGPDGSTVAYRPDGTLANTWVSAREPLPDVITKVGDVYKRDLVGGGDVWYNADGTVDYVVDEADNKTTFTYQNFANGPAVSQIHLPVKATGQTIHAYTFEYDGSGRLQRVRSLDGDGTSWRDSDVTPGTNGPSRIEGPDNVGVDLLYAVAGLLTQITDARGVQTTIDYDANPTQTGPNPDRLKVDRVQSVSAPPPAAPLPNMTYDYLAFSTFGFLHPVRWDVRYAEIDGPRTSVTDISRMWLTGFYAPVRVQDPFGATTTITYNETWPRVVREVQYPLRSVDSDQRRTVTTDLDGQGRVQTVVDDAVCDAAGCATTSYTWDDNWHRIKSVTSPTMEVRETDWNADGLPNWQRNGGLDDTKTDFVYLPANPALVERILAPESNSGEFTTIGYDVLGNTSSITTAIGHTTTFQRDGIGRIIKTITDVENGVQRTDSTVYDVMNRVTYTASWSNQEADTIKVTTVYDPITGDRKEVSRRSEPDRNSIGDVKERWTYDGFGRVETEENSAGLSAILTYDEAGNLATRTNRKGETVTFDSYDALNRLTQKTVPTVTRSRTSDDLLNAPYQGSPLYDNSDIVIPTEVTQFAYDEHGNMIKADNPDARVRRGYDMAGRLVADSLWLREWGGSSFAQQHLYVTTYGYDKSNRRTSMLRPSQFDAAGTAVTYDYDAVFGQLDQVVGGGQTIDWEFDDRGRPEVRTFNGGAIRDSTFYDVVDRLERHAFVVPGQLDWTKRTGEAHYYALDDDLTYYSGGRLKQVDDQIGLTDYQYHGLGMLVQRVKQLHASGGGGGGGGGTSARYLDVTGTELASKTGHSGLMGEQKMTWAFWVKGQGQSGKIGGIAGSGDPHRVWWFEADNAGSELRVVLFNGDPAFWDPAFVNFSGLSTNGSTWNFVVVQYDGTESTPADRLKVWIDDSPATQVGHIGDPLPTNLHTDTTSPIPALEWGHLSAYGSPFKGGLGELIILNDLLTAQERTDWYQNGIEFTHSDIVSGYRWKDDADSETSLNDLTPNSSFVSTTWGDAGTAYPVRSTSSSSSSLPTLGCFTAITDFLNKECNKYDALGNLFESERAGAQNAPTPGQSYERTAFPGYEFGTGRYLENDRTQANGETTIYDADGNRVFYTPGSTPVGSIREISEYAYDAEGRLRQADARKCQVELYNGNFACFPPDGQAARHWGSESTYRYDALGRRVITYTTLSSYLCNKLNCPGDITRTVWDGDQILYEARYPSRDIALPLFSGGFETVVADLERHTGVVDLRIEQCVDTSDGSIEEGGNSCPPTNVSGAQFQIQKVEATHHPFGVVGYIHGPGLDSPLIIERHFLDPTDPTTIERIAPVMGTRGDMVDGIDLSHGGRMECFVRRGTVCQDFEWPGASWFANYELHDYKLLNDGPTFWMGSLVDNKRDASGLMYMRNRYYDPTSGQFTQEDPIGLAGGLNLYGYANGDPVNLSDPFGLCPMCPLLALAARVAGPRVATWVGLRAMPLVGAAGRFLGSLSRPGAEPDDAVLSGANFAQKTYRETFQDGGRFAEKTIDDIATGLRNGDLTPTDVRIDYVVRDGNTLILNTRSAQALERAGIPREQWEAVNRTGQDLYEALLSDQLRRNNLTSEGIETVRSSGN